MTDLMIAVGADVRRDYLAAGVGSLDRFFVVHSPIGIDEFVATRRMSESERTSLRRRFGLPDDRPTIVAAGIFEPRKRHDLMLRELAPLLRRGIAHLVIAGTGYQGDVLKALARDLRVEGSVTFPGYLNNLADLVAASSLVIHASTAEGVPQIVIQGLASGIPIVASEVEGLTEIPSAPITIVPRSGSSLGDAVAAALAQPWPAPVPVDCLWGWTVEGVEESLSRFHAALTRTLAGQADRTVPLSSDTVDSTTPSLR